MNYKTLIQILNDDCNCDCIKKGQHKTAGYVSWVIENCSNNLTFPLAGHPDWEVDEMIIVTLKDALRLNPHPLLN